MDRGREFRLFLHINIKKIMVRFDWLNEIEKFNTDELALSESRYSALVRSLTRSKIKFTIQNNGFEIRNTFPEVDFRNFCKRCKMSKMELFHYLNEIELKFMTASEEETEYKPEKMKISIDFQVKRKQDIKVSSMILI